MANFSRLKGALPLLAVWGTLLVAAMLAGSQSPPAEDEQARPSVFFTDKTGGRALYLTLLELFGENRVTLLRGPFDRDLTNQVDTLIVQGPELSLDENDRLALAGWLEEGGQLILLSQDDWPLTQPDGSQKTLLDTYAVKHTGKLQEPARQRSQSWSLLARPGASWAGSYKPFFGVDGEVLVVEVPVKKGRILATADAGILCNGRIQEADNAPWLVHLLKRGGGHVAFDEFHLGFGDRAELSQLVQRFLFSRWGTAFLQLLVAGFLALVVCRRRFGRVVQPWPEPAQDSLKLMEARAGMLESAQATRLGLELTVSQLCFHLRAPGGRQPELAEIRQRYAEGSALAQSLDHLIQATAQTHRRLSPQELRRLVTLAQQIRSEVLCGTTTSGT